MEPLDRLKDIQDAMGDEFLCFVDDRKMYNAIQKKIISSISVMDDVLLVFYLPKKGMDVKSMDKFKLGTMLPEWEKIDFTKYRRQYRKEQ